MRENLRRPLLFLITVGTGSLIIFIDATAEVIIAGTVFAGFLALFVTGALDFAELKPSKLRAALREFGKKKEQPAAAAESPARSSKRIDLPGMLGTFTASIRETIASARAPEGEKKGKIETIDAMLDQAVKGAVPDPAITPAPPKAGGGALDPLASLADLEFDSLDGLDLDGETSSPETIFDPDQISLLSAEDTDAISDILKSHQSDLVEFEIPAEIDLPGEPQAILPPIAADVPELPGDESMPDMSALSEELSALDDLDVDDFEIDLGGEDEEEKEEEADAEDLVSEADILGELEEEPKEDFDMVSFASGGSVDDDLISALKADTKKKKFVEDISLVRDLKGEKFHAEDLAAELEDVLTSMGPQR